jgi:predicted PurR-regulated permease PerM
MINVKLFMVIFILFLIFVGFQLYFYINTYKQNQNKLQKIENYENTLKDIDNNITKKEYILDDMSLENLLEDYNNLKYNN